MRITNIEIDNFRGIHHASVIFPRSSRLICMIGAGDSGKSTLLTAVEWGLWPTWNLIVRDTDFYNCEIANPIVIEVSISEIPDALQKEEKFGLYLRDFAGSIKGDNDEPTDTGTIILTIRFTVDETLEPKWEVVTNRTDPKPISQADRRILSFGTVGFDQDKDFQWGRGSVLQKYTESRSALHSAFTQAIRKAAKDVNLDRLDTVSTEMEKVGKQYGVNFNGELHNRLLMQNNSYSATVGIFDEKVPFNQRGLGSRRLLSIGMNIDAYCDGTVVLVDEVETGLEPYRISTLINEFRSQFKEQGQIIMTTHSNSVVCECNIDELCVVSNNTGELNFFELDKESDIKNSVQALIRKNPDAFLCRRLIVCEGKTEIGLLRAFEQYIYRRDSVRFAFYGTGYVLGDGGDRTLKVARYMKKCGYDVSVMMDSDVAAEDKDKSEAEAEGISVFCWEKGFAVEEQIFHDSSLEIIEKLLEYAAHEKTWDHVITKLNALFSDEPRPYYFSDENQEIHFNDNISEKNKTGIGTIAKNNNWYKQIGKGQDIGNIIFAEYGNMRDCGFKRTIDNLQRWVTCHER